MVEAERGVLDGRRAHKTTFCRFSRFSASPLAAHLTLLRGVLGVIYQVLASALVRPMTDAWI